MSANSSNSGPHITGPTPYEHARHLLSGGMGPELDKLSLIGISLMFLAAD